jgi:hypothetical protein
MTAGSCRVRENVRPKGSTMVSSSAPHAIGSCARQAPRTGEQTVVPLKTPIPLYISYVTAFLGPDGLMQYRRDVYGRDKNLLDALARRGQGAWEK